MFRWFESLSYLDNQIIHTHSNKAVCHAVTMQCNVPPGEALLSNCGLARARHSANPAFSAFPARQDTT